MEQNKEHIFLELPFDAKSFLYGHLGNPMSEPASLTDEQLISICRLKIDPKRNSSSGEFSSLFPRPERDSRYDPVLVDLGNRAFGMSMWFIQIGNWFFEDRMLFVRSPDWSPNKKTWELLPPGYIYGDELLPQYVLKEVTDKNRATIELFEKHMKENEY